MAKTDSKAVSYRLRNDVIWMLEDLVTAWGCTATGAVERAITEAKLRVEAGKAGEADLPLPGAPHGAGESFVERARRTVNHPAVVSDPNVGAHGHCAHCGKEFELVPGAPPTSICRGCVVEGHRGGTDCRKCAEREHYAEKMASDKGAIATGRTDIDVTFFSD